MIVHSARHQNIAKQFLGVRNYFKNTLTSFQSLCRNNWKRICVADQERFLPEPEPSSPYLDPLIANNN